MSRTPWAIHTKPLGDLDPEIVVLAATGEDAFAVAALHGVRFPADDEARAVRGKAPCDSCVGYSGALHSAYCRVCAAGSGHAYAARKLREVIRQQCPDRLTEPPRDGEKPSRQDQVIGVVVPCPCRMTPAPEPEHKDQRATRRT